MKKRLKPLFFARARNGLFLLLGFFRRWRRRSGNHPPNRVLEFDAVNSQVNGARHGGTIAQNRWTRKPVLPGLVCLNIIAGVVNASGVKLLILLIKTHFSPCGKRSGGR
jgi:hypothetical protein